ncbi:MAG: hypothetical protein R3B13_21245 [Polyangiaceae bacterium]
MLARVAATIALALTLGGCGESQDAKSASDAGGDAAADGSLPPCPECNGATLLCSQQSGDAGLGASFHLTEVTATSCGGEREFGPGHATIKCDIGELCFDSDCVKYSFDGVRTMIAIAGASGIKCQVW